MEHCLHQGTMKFPTYTFFPLELYRVPELYKLQKGFIGNVWNPNLGLYKIPTRDWIISQLGLYKIPTWDCVKSQLGLNKIPGGNDAITTVKNATPRYEISCFVGLRAFQVEFYHCSSQNPLRRPLPRHATTNKKMHRPTRQKGISRTTREHPFFLFVSISHSQQINATNTDKSTHHPKKKEPSPW